MNSPSTFYYSLTNINDLDENIISSNKSKRTLSKLDVGYESEDENHHSDKHLRPMMSQMKKSQSDFLIGQQMNNQKNLFISRTYSLPSFEHQHHLPTWWRQSITSAYDTCSNPDMDLSLEETKKSQAKTSLLMYSKKYTKFNRTQSLSQQQSLSPPSTENHKPKKIPSNPPSNSYDASAEYTDPEQSENDVDILSSDFNSTSPIHRYPNPESQFYNRYTTTTTTTTTTTGYSSDVELGTTTTPSETEDQQTPHIGENQRIKEDFCPERSSFQLDLDFFPQTIKKNESRSSIYYPWRIVPYCSLSCIISISFNRWIDSDKDWTIESSIIGQFKW